MESSKKPLVVRALREMARYLELQGENPFKVRAYETGADRIAGTEDLDELVASGRLAQLPGIGQSLAAKVAELVATGRLAALEEVKAAFPPRILDLLEVQDLGPKKAKALFEQLGVGSLDELEAACRAGQVRGLKGFGLKTEEKLLAGLELARRTRAAGGRKLLGEVLPQAEALLAWLEQAPGLQRASLGGSVRRMRETVADVDLLASAKDPAPVFAHFKAWPGVAQVIGEGESKCSVRLADGDLQVDLRVVPDEDFATALHHFTGSKAHHLRLRALAQEKGLTISEWGVFRLHPGKQVARPRTARHEGAQEKLPVREEKDLYALLGMQHVPPELREDWGEVEAALAGRLPKDLITLGEVKGNVHVHSTWSDGRDSLEALAREAKALGLSYLTVTEHSQTAAYAGGLTVARLQAQWDEIERVAELVGITLFKGVESDILEDGRLDYPDEVLERLDLVIGSVHQRYGQGEEAMTARVLKAFDNPHLRIWGHPTGRLMGQREPAPLRMDELLDRAAEKGVAVEVNGSPQRLDLSAQHVRLALQRGVRLAVSTDAHAVGELGRHLPLAVATARKGWARAADVVNARSAKDFRAWLARGRA